ncbi:hypothetical protein GLOTRDRAFT_120925 [Gloeophyllum trabeum ATCC 11539]|uniref:RRM Nup35-type domain-containing protein n=1 Tax=Gloeophyllum trabeum (strain ATCC 11539 / FP-39264 / Madison 617) TaxID=670483 RepID=S7QA89_GLOTA|nr:uncharacterized protein GLOTRDRAFT_120925 [Gloeophyllum trabeum ATCC 11539]EPQ56432.1 hypothetical protein GLOTRDRAFT_120925 [Gloeophyllum trabeum ATCC 11539]
MFSSSYGNAPPRNNFDLSQDRQKQYSAGSSYSSPFVPAANSPFATSKDPGPSLPPSWASAIRPTYQTGYMLSDPPPGMMAPDTGRGELPLIPTKAKLSPLLTRGLDHRSNNTSMFASKKDQLLPDEEGPPTLSVHDIPNEPADPNVVRMRLSQRKYPEDLPSTPKPRHSRSQTTSGTPVGTTPSSQPLYVIVYGYPPDRYSATVEYFRSLGDTTEADPNAEIVNCFRIGYKKPIDALRAIKKNGDVLSGAWMVGVKWADQAQAEAALGKGVVRHMDHVYQVADQYGGSPDVMDTSSSPNPMDTRPPVGTPLKLAPANAAFKPHESQHFNFPIPGQNGSPDKGIVGKVSDLIFGW